MKIEDVVKMSSEIKPEPRLCFEEWCKATIGSGWGAAIHDYVTHHREDLIPLLRAVYNSGVMAGDSEASARRDKGGNE